MNQRNEIAVPAPDALKSFMAELLRHYANDAMQVAKDLPVLLGKLRGLPLERSEPTSREEFIGASDVSVLINLMESLRKPLKAVESA